MNIRDIVGIFSRAAVSGLSFAMCVTTFAVGPNIVVIVADDLGLGDIGRQHTERTGNPPLAPTPTLDALANEGMWFTDAHSPAALCAPSRYAFMSGNYNFRSYSPGGVWNAFGLSAITPSDTTLGSLMQSAGYTTGFVGKWHMGGDYYATGTTTVSRINDANATPAQVDMSSWIGGGPQDIGFDFDFTVATGVQGPTYLAHENGEWFPWSVDSALIFYDEDSASDPLFVSDKGPGIGDSNWDARDLNMLLADKASSFVTSSAAAGEPFFLYYCSPAVHIPHTPPTSIDGTAISGTTPTSHLDMNRVLDLEVKRIIDALKAAGVYENTLIIFTSDNGGLIDWAAQNAGHFSNGGFRGNKNQAFEGGHRVPFIAVWPGVIPANTRCDSMINGTDILATLAAVTGTSFSDDQAKDSHSLFPILIGNTGYEPRSEMMQQGGSGAELMLRQGPWKLMLSSSKGHNNLSKSDTVAWKLYNLDDNPTESDSGNLVDDPAYADRVSTMYERYWEIRESSARTAPSYGAPAYTSGNILLDEDFSEIGLGDTTGTNDQIEDGSYNTGLRVNNHSLAEIKTGAGFGSGNVLQLSTGTNPTGGWGAVSAHTPYPVSLAVGQEVVLSFDMLVQAIPEGTSNINIELRMTDANNISRPFTEYFNATVDDVVNVSWTVVVDADMAKASDISIWIPIEGFPTNYSTTGPNGNGTEIDVMQIDNIQLSTSGTSGGFFQFTEQFGLVGGAADDNDRDGLANVFEFVFGLDPTVSDWTLEPVIAYDPEDEMSYLSLTYPRSKSAEDYSAHRIWRSTDLSENAWKLGQTKVVSVEPDDVDADIEYVTERSLFPVSGGREFLRFDAITVE